MRRMLRAVLVAPTLALLSAACTTAMVQQTGAAAQLGPELTVERFLQAANNRDLETMGRLFGTADGPISDTGSTFACAFKKIGSWFGGTPCRSRNNVQIRMETIARLLAHQDYKITREEQVAGRDHPSIRVFVDLTVRGLQVSDIPFVVVQRPNGTWLVEQIGLQQLLAKEG